MTANGYQMGHDAVVYPLHYLNAVADAYGVLDIGGTNGSTAWIDMSQFERVFAFVQISSFDAADDLDECRLEQATDSSGSNAKDLTTDGAGATNDYNASTPVDSAGEFVILEAKAEDLDVSGGFQFVRLYVAEGGNTGVDNVLGFVVAYGAAHKRKEQQGAATAAQKVYIRAG